MSSNSERPNPNTIAVLEMIAAGNSYEQILSAYPDFTYHDIFLAARDALDKINTHKPASEGLDPIRKSYRRAYVKWGSKEEREVKVLIDDGLTVAQIASRLQRQRSAIASRIVKLNLTSRLDPSEQSELLRIIKLHLKNADPWFGHSDER